MYFGGDLRHFWLGILVSTMMLVACSSSSVKSSSSVTLSSSVESSSSSSVPEGYVDPSTVVKGILTDARDGQTYKTVTIGTQTWMAENLNFETENSFCYNDSAEYCPKFGRLYLWSTAMDSVGTWSTNGKGCGYEKYCSPTYPVRGVCPEGWHLPTVAEFETLIDAVGGISIASKVLKSQASWNGNGNGKDAFAFSAIPAGYRYSNGNFFDEGSRAYIWSSVENGSYGAYYMGLHYVYDDYACPSSLTKYFGFSVRCVKDEP